MSKKKNLSIWKPKIPNNIQLTGELRNFLCEQAVGQQNAVRFNTLFQMTFGDPKKYNNYQLFVFVARLKRALSYLRRQKGFFVVPVKDDETNEIKYCIPTKMDDLVTYIRIYETNKKRYKAKINKAIKFIEKKEYNKLISR